MLLDLNEQSKTSRLTMNFRETKIMPNRPTEPLIIDKTEIQLVDEYIYLGQLVTLNDKMSIEIKTKVCPKHGRPSGDSNLSSWTNLSTENLDSMP
jgi:hypothetical protein